MAIRLLDTKAVLSIEGYMVKMFFKKKKDSIAVYVDIR